MALLAVLALPACPQPQEQLEPAAIFRVTVVGRTAKAVNYRHRSGATKIDFQGTSLLPLARGEAKVESKQGYIEIEVAFRNLEPATRFGPEYLTYVMWAITPEGRASNLGEVILNGSRSKLNVTTELQVFGLVVTAEPYFAVTLPSDVVVMENVVRQDTKGKIEEIDAKYELLQRGQYTFSLTEEDIQKMRLDPRTPLELYQARNAVRIARSVGAARSAPETFRKAEHLLDQAERDHERKANRRLVIQAAREAVQSAEDARLIAVRRQDQEYRTAERREAAEREARARAEAEAQRAAAEASLAAAKLAQQEVEKSRLETERARLEADRHRLEAEKAALRVEQIRARTEREKAEFRSRLASQWNLVFDSQDPARGWILKLPHILEDPAGRERLARAAGFVLALPGLMIEVTAPPDLGAAVRDFLLAHGVPGESIRLQEADTAELVVSGDLATASR